MKQEKEMQATSLQRFFEENSNVCIRAQVINGEPWFVAKDVCQALGHTNHRVAIQSLDDDEKGVRKVYTPGGMQEITFVNESGLYALIMRSNKPNAKPFRKWITKDVLPTIRKTGGYIIPESLRRNGVDGIFYKGMKLYPYLDMLVAIGYSKRSGSVAKRRRSYPDCFVKVFGRNFITEELATQLEDEHRIAARRFEMKNRQQSLPFKEA